MNVRPGALSALLAALLAAALFGTTGTAQALGPDGTDPASVGALRIAVGASVLALAVVGRYRRAVRPIRAGRLPTWTLVLVGGLCVASYQACFFLGVSRTGVAVGTVVALGVAPLATGLLAMLLGERPDPVWTGATAVAVVGVVLLVMGSGSSTTSVDLLGVAAAVGAGVSYAGYTVAARSLLLRGADGVRVMAGFFATGALVLLPVLLLHPPAWALTARGAAMVLWLGVMTTAVAYLLFQHALSGLSARTVSTLTLGEPVTATVLGVVVLSERLSTLTALGVVVVVVGLLLTGLPRRSPAPDAAPVTAAPADLP